MKKLMRLVLGASCMVLGAGAAFAEPKVTIDKIEDTSVWATKKVTYTVSDAPVSDSMSCYLLAFDVTAYGVTKNIKMGGAQNGTFTYTLDTAAIFGETRKDPQAKIRVSLEKVFDKAPVQLWEGGPYFARCNIGANAPHEAGYYFWWGDTVGYTNSSGEVAGSGKWVDDGSWVSVKDGTTIIKFDANIAPANSTFRKEVETLTTEGWIDASGNLVAEHDAATVHLGAPWRLPTLEELTNLVSEDVCERKWTTDWEGTGASGYIVKGKGAYASNSVFFPSVGYADGSRFFNYGGNYWSSAPNSQSGMYDYAWILAFGSTTFYKADCRRYYGYPIRPVR